MRRLLSELAGYLATLSSAVARGWNAFFFTPADPTALGLIRVIVGLLLFWSMAIYGLDLRAFFGSDGWADPAVVQLFQHDQTPWGWSFWAVVPDGLLRPAWVACMVVLALFTVGLGSRLTAVLAWAIVVSTVRRSPVSLFGFDQIVSTLALYLAATGASGQAVSLDRYLARLRRARAELSARRRDGRWPLPPGVPEPTISANLALRLIQLHLVLIYGMAGLAKLQGPAWWNGVAIWGTLAAGEFRLFNLTWLAAWPLAISALTHAGLAFELLYPVLVWPRVTRPLMLGVAAALHLGVGLTLGLSEFGVAMLAANLAFVSGVWLRSLVTGRDQPAGRVIYDGACPRCRASMAALMAGDPDRVIAPVDLTVVDVSTIDPRLTASACMEAMHVVRADGRVSAGYDAVLVLARWVPLFWPFALVGSIPGVVAIGRRVYNHLAATRPRDCTDEVCGLHAPRGHAQAPAKTTADSGRTPP